MLLSEKISTLSDIYDCAVDPALWPETLGRINGQLNGAFLSVNLFDKATQTGTAAWHSDWDEDWIERLNGFALEVPGMSHQLFGPIDTPTSALGNVSESEFRNSRISREWGAPQGLFDAGSAKFVETASTIGILSFVVRDNRPAVTRDELDHVQLLSPHIRRAMMIGQIMEHKDVSLGAYRQVLDQLAYPVVFTDQTGRIHHANGPAHAILTSGAGLKERMGKLAVDNPRTAPAFALALARAARGDRAIGLHGIGVPLERMGEAPMIAYVLPLNQSDTRHVTGGPSVSVFIATAASSMPVADAVISTLYGLTPAEIRVARNLLAGQNVEAIADTTAVSLNTVRSHVRRVLEKTGCSRQAELVALLASLAPPVSAPMSSAP